MSTKRFWGIIVFLIFILLVLLGSLLYPAIKKGAFSEIFNEIQVQLPPLIHQNNKPPIVSIIACADYCPGPQEKYMVRVYQGVEDPEECRKIGGKPSSYTGWTTVYYCIAE